MDDAPLNEQPRPRRMPPCLFALLALALLPLFACAGGSSAPIGSAVNVTLHDFAIRSSTAVSTEPSVVFRVQNQAPVTHEFVVVRTDLPADQLPMASDGLSVDEEQLRPAGEINQVAAGTTETLSVHLAPGRYVFFCNLEGHYLGGMHGVLEVTGDVAGS